MQYMYAHFFYYSEKFNIILVFIARDLRILIDVWKYSDKTLLCAYMWQENAPKRLYS